MLGQTFYHGIIKRVIIAFGELFSDIQIEHYDKDKKKAQVIRVPINYGPKEKWYRQITENPDKQRDVKLSVPRMSFEMGQIQFDADRKLMHNYSHTIDHYKVYTPVPYNLGLTLFLYTRTQEDTLALIEQILPYFQTSLDLTIDVISTPLIRQIVPINLDSNSSEDNWDENMDTRHIISTLSFTAKINLYGPIIKPSMIKRVIADVGSAKPVPNDNPANVTYTAELNPFVETNKESDPHTVLEDWSN